MKKSMSDARPPRPNGTASNTATRFDDNGGSVSATAALDLTSAGQGLKRRRADVAVVLA